MRIPSALATLVALAATPLHAAADCASAPGPEPPGCSTGVYVFTQSVTDLDGGDVLPGDRLRFTVVLSNFEPCEVAGTFVDAMHPLLNSDASLEVMAFACPALGGECATCPPPVGNCSAEACQAGGSGGTGFVRVEDLAIQPSAAVTIEYEVTVSPAARDDDLICNQGRYEFCDDFAADRCGLTEDPMQPGEAACVRVTRPSGGGPALLRNDLLRTIAPPSTPLGDIFVGADPACPPAPDVSLVPYGPAPACAAVEGEGLVPEDNGSDDDDDLYLTDFPSGAVDPESGVLTAPQRPLIFWQLQGAPANSLRVVADAATATVRLLY